MAADLWAKLGFWGLKIRMLFEALCSTTSAKGKPLLLLLAFFIGSVRAELAQAEGRRSKINPNWIEFKPNSSAAKREKPLNRLDLTGQFQSWSDQFQSWGAGAIWKTQNQLEKIEKEVSTSRGASYHLVTCYLPFVVLAESWQDVAHVLLQLSKLPQLGNKSLRS